MSLSIGFLLPYGEPSDGFFADSFLAELCARVRRAGHSSRLVRAYYDGREPSRDAEVAARLRAWLAEHEIDVVVYERLFDAGPVVKHLAERPGARAVLVWRGGDSFDDEACLDLVLGASVGPTRAGTTRRTPSTAEVAAGFEQLVLALGEGREPAAVPGVAAVREGALQPAAEVLPRGGPRPPFDAVVEQDVICLGAPPRVVRKTLFGNVGCPFAADPADNPHYAGVDLSSAAHPALARLGCAFCALGGDYERRPDDAVVRELVEQARFWTSHLPGLEELVLSDQHPVRFLPALLAAARDAGVPRIRWLFPMRADAVLRETGRLRAAIGAARDQGYVLETYLTGFESFSDRELLRYNKGVTQRELLTAVATLRELARESEGAFEYAHARGHSLILWSPWTQPADVRESVEVIRAEGLREFFHELGRNRLRLYPDLPIHHAAARDGVLTARWDEGDEGAGRRKGYNAERPWRFLNPRTRLAYELALRMRSRLGLETEAAQLLAACAFADSSLGEERGGTAVMDAIEGLAAALQRARHGSASVTRAAVVRFAGPCNNACEGCAQRERYLADDRSVVLGRVAVARREGRPVVLAGREPSIHPAFLEVVRAARGDDERLVGVVTNARRFAYRRFAEAAVATGLRAASVKLFAPREAEADAIARSPGAYAEAVRGVLTLRTLGIPVELRAPLEGRNLAIAERFADAAARLGASQLRVEAALDAVGLARLDEARDALARLVGRAEGLGVALVASPLASGTTLFDALPARGDRS